MLASQVLGNDFGALSDPWNPRHPRNPKEWRQSRVGSILLSKITRFEFAYFPKETYLWEFPPSEYDWWFLTIHVNHCKLCYNYDHPRNYYMFHTSVLFYPQLLSFPIQVPYKNRKIIFPYWPTINPTNLGSFKQSHPRRCICMDDLPIHERWKMATLKGKWLGSGLRWIRVQHFPRLGSIQVPSDRWDWFTWWN